MQDPGVPERQPARPAGDDALPGVLYNLSRRVAFTARRTTVSG